MQIQVCMFESNACLFHCISRKCKYEIYQFIQFNAFLYCNTKTYYFVQLASSKYNIFSTKINAAIGLLPDSFSDGDSIGKNPQWLTMAAFKRFTICPGVSRHDQRHDDMRQSIERQLHCGRGSSSGVQFTLETSHDVVLHDPIVRRVFRVRRS